MGQGFKYLYVFLAWVVFSLSGYGQVVYDENTPLESRLPWVETDQVNKDDAVSGGWFYNLGITGIRVLFDETEPKALKVKYVFPNAPAAGRIFSGDVIIGTSEGLFQESHQNGYGEEVFGARGPIGEFAVELEKAQGSGGSGTITLRVRRGAQTLNVPVVIGKRYGSYRPTYPEDCPKSALILRENLDFLLERQYYNGSWGSPISNCFAGLALLSDGGVREMAAARRLAEFHANLTARPPGGRADGGVLSNWNGMAAAIFLSEYYLATGESWVIGELNEVREFLLWSQYRNSTPPPSGQDNQDGGWGHNPGFDGYGPMAMTTGQGALSLALIQRCGLPVSRNQLDAAYDFLERGTGGNGYVWYGASVPPGRDNDYADMGRTGAAAVSHYLSPYQDATYRNRARNYSKMIGDFPKSFVDTHGSHAMGMGFVGMGVSFDPVALRKLLDANKWWFALAQTHEEAIYNQPARDHSTPNGGMRIEVSAVTAFIFSIPDHNLHVTGKSVDYDEWAWGSGQLSALHPWGDLDGDLLSNWQEFLRLEYGRDRAAFSTPPRAESPYSVTMTAATNSRGSGEVEYRFTELSGGPGGKSTGWQSSRTFVNSGLWPNMTYRYRVEQRIGTVRLEASSEVSVRTPVGRAPQGVIEVGDRASFSVADGSGYLDVEGIGAFDANMADKLVVAVSVEHGFQNGSGKVNGITYAGKPLTLASQSRGDRGAAEIWYLDHPGPIGSGKLKVSSDGFGAGTAYTLFGTSVGVSQVATASGSGVSSVGLQNTLPGSLVLSMITNSGSLNATLGGTAEIPGVPTPLQSLKHGGTGSWGFVAFDNFIHRQGGHATGYQFSDGSSVMNSPYRTRTGDGYSINLVSVEFPSLHSDVLEAHRISDQVFQYARRSEKAGTHNFLFEFSNDLEAWTIYQGATQIVVGNSDNGVQTVQVTLAPGDFVPPAKFFRIRMSPK